MAESQPPVILESVSNRIGYITLNRPEVMNAINDALPSALAAAVQRMEGRSDVHCIVLSGAGKGFCGGYDLSLYAERRGTNAGWQDSTKGPWDPMVDYAMMARNTRDFMSLFRCLKPVVVKVHGSGAVAGGSDIALCGDFLIMSETARIGYPPARVWGCPTTAQWMSRVGPAGAKRMLLTGDLIDGKEAFRMGIATAVVPEEEIDAEVERWAQKIAAIPCNQLAMHKLLVNSTIQAELSNSQLLATLFDGIARHSPEGAQFKALAEASGWKAAVASRDAHSKAKL